MGHGFRAAPVLQRENHLAGNNSARHRSHRHMSTDGFAQLVDAHYTALYRFALSLARNSADAGDLVQQTFFIWATKGHGLRDSGKAKSWLFTTLYREFIRGRRRDSRSTSIEGMTGGETDFPAEEIDQVAKMDAASVMTALQSVDEVFVPGLVHWAIGVGGVVAARPLLVVARLAPGH